MLSNQEPIPLQAFLAVMKQDIVAAAWHAELGALPDSDPFAALAAAKAKWAGREPELIFGAVDIDLLATEGE